MDKICLKYFKAFPDYEVILEPTGHSMLVCGENGSGKSSIYEALKWIFFRNEILRERIPASTQEEERPGLENAIKAEYNNRQFHQSFELQVNDTDYLHFPTNDYQVSMINSDCLVIDNQITITSLLQKASVQVDDLTVFMRENRSLLVEYVNDMLANRFREQISISISEDAPYVCTIEDRKRHLSAFEYLGLVYNEAKLHIIIFLIFFSIVLLTKKNEKSKLLVIDDVISSMDAANRSLFIRYLLETFIAEGYQIFIFTHNVSFFNLFNYINNNHLRADAQTTWITYHLYESEGKPKVYPYQNEKTIDELISLLKDQATNGLSLDDVGNQYRKKFESLVHRFTELLMIGANEETTNLIKALSSDYYYYCGCQKDVHVLIDELYSIVNNVPKDLVYGKIKAKINSYRTKNESLKIILNDIVLCQKIILHPMSHVGGEMVNYTAKELELTLELMKKLDNAIIKMTTHPEVTRM